LVDRNRESILFDIHHSQPTERLSNRLGSREMLESNYNMAQRFRLVANTESDIQAIDPRSLENRVRRAHAAIWAGGKRDPLTAFDEWSKLLFAKIWDERHTPNGKPREMQVAANESQTMTASRIRQRFREARRGDPTVFLDDRIMLPDDKVVEVVRLIEEIGFTLCGLDALGTAFERFFGSIFRGDLGQYFTPRELARFVCAVIEPKDTDYVLDPTVGSGGFLLETLIQVWHWLDDNYAGQPDAERRKIDFALHHLYGIEINATLGRVCKTNLVIHKDGHTNIESERSCLDSTFSLPRLRYDGTMFNIVVGNPPFGDEVHEGDRDRLGDGSLKDFVLSENEDQISSELIIVERGLQFLVPGGMLGMVVPDGSLNNTGEGSRCPAFRRWLLSHARIEMVVSLPDFAFRKSGAQNKTSLLFLRKHTQVEKAAFDAAYDEYLDKHNIEGKPTIEQEKQAILHALEQNPYTVFLAEVDKIGYTPTGVPTSANQLYQMDGNNRVDLDNLNTVLGQYRRYKACPTAYTSVTTPSCHVINIVDLVRAHPSYRLDPKFHLFQLERIQDPPPNMNKYSLDKLLVRREEEVWPTTQPDIEFLTLTLSQEGVLSPREAGKGQNPPSWYGAYFTNGSRWFRAYTNDLIVSQIDLWKGCVAVIPPEFDQAIVTQEFPVYIVDRSRLDPRYLAILLRSKYFQRALAAINTGHSNRRHIQQDDFLALEVFLPDLNIQRDIADIVERVRRTIDRASDDYRTLLESVEEVVLGIRDPIDFINQTMQTQN
jgi:type I restriction enzyme M protein